MNIPLDEWSGSKATKELHETIKKYQEASSRQTQQMIWLTGAIAILTVALLCGLALQIAISLSK
jgi:hypothetical protein